MISMEIFEKLIRRGFKYGLAGFSTYIIDLSLVFLLINFFGFNITLALGIGFLVGVHLNFLIAYYVVYRGTTQTLQTGYLNFITLALFGALIIGFGTTYLVEITALPLIFARTIIATVIGTTNFLINTFYNFKLL